MKNLLYIILLLSFTSHTRGINKEPEQNDGFTLIELFTSQGCSSCPPADKLLSQTLEEAKLKGKNILALSFHVDYWNYLGWRDPFSNPDFTKRQNDYATKLNLSSIYTPQAVVNGKYEFVGSNKSKLSEAISKSLNNIPEVLFSELNGSINNDKSVHVRFKLKGNFANCSINFALISDKEITNVKRGENSGKTLISENVVRKLVTRDAIESGEIVLDTDQMLNNFSVIAFIQDKKSFEVTYASKVVFTKSN